MQSAPRIVLLVITALAASLAGVSYDGLSAAPATDRCEPAEAAGKPVPPAPSESPKGKFRILWHISTQIEDLADADKNPSSQQYIVDVQKRVDGYYFTALPHQVGYWHGRRPPECSTNFVRARDRLGIEEAKRLRDECQGKFLSGVGSNDASEPRNDLENMYRAALKSVIRNLDIKAEQQRGKVVLGQMLLTAHDWAYDKSQDKLALKRLPRTYCFMNSTGVSVNNVLAYQEPHSQKRNGSLLVLGKDQTESTTASARQANLPWNLKVIELLHDSFAEARVPLSKFSINVRH
jgi:hypothetical protein